MGQSSGRRGSAGGPAARCDLGTVKKVALALSVSSVMLTNGMGVGYPGVTLPAMQSNTSSLVLDDSQASWIASLPQITTIVGCFMSGTMIDRWGRKIGTIFATVSSLAGWSMLGLGERVWVLYLGRLVCGLGSGLGSTTVSVLLAESADPHFRGVVTNFKNIAFSAGLTIVYVLGFFYKDDWKRVALVSCLVPGLSFLLVVFFVPESEVWKNSRLQTNNNNNIAGNNNNSGLKINTNWSQFWKSRHRPEVYKPCVIINIFYLLRQSSGTSVLLSYTVSLAVAAGVEGDPYLVAIGVGLSRCVGGVLASYLSGRWGRRGPVSYAGSLTSFAMIWLAYMAPRDTPAQSPPTTASPTSSSSSSSSWIQLYLVPAFLVVYVLNATIFSDIPRSMLSELFPTDVRGMATAIGTSMTFFAAFLALKIYPVMLSTLGRQGTFVAFAVITVSSAVWAIFLLPETHGKSFKEIEAMFTGVKSEDAAEAEDKELTVPLRGTKEGEQEPNNKGPEAIDVQ